MVKSLQQYFPQIRTKAEILNEIYKNRRLKAVYYSWSKEQQELFLDVCSGMKGVKVLYDSFFKEVFNVDIRKERLEELLSTLLEEKIKILHVLPLESNRIADEGALMIMDIVVELEDGRIANVECQRIGYHFPGQRAACYSADLLMRQYRRVKRERKDAGETFSYRDVKKIYTIVFFEKSPEEFLKDPKKYIHHSQQKMDTGVELDLLQEYTFATLDIFQDVMQNKSVQNDLDAWLMFLSTDDPERIVELLNKYPQFYELYDDIYKLCCNTEKVMGMFSEELKELDDNTVLYMLDEYEKKMDDAKQELDDAHQKLDDAHQKVDLVVKQLESAIKRTIEKRQAENVSKEKMVEELQMIFGIDEKNAKEKVELYWE